MVNRYLRFTGLRVTFVKNFTVVSGDVGLTIQEACTDPACYADQRIAFMHGYLHDFSMGGQFGSGIFLYGKKSSTQNVNTDMDVFLSDVIFSPNWTGVRRLGYDELRRLHRRHGVVS